MKRTIKILMLFCMTLSLSACGKSDEDVAKDVQSKIDKAKWTIKHDPEAGTALDYLNLYTDSKAKQEFSLALYKDEKKVTYIGFSIRKSEEETITYDAEKDEDISYILKDSEDVCSYNIPNDTLEEDYSTTTSCKSTAKKSSQELIKSRDEILDKADITLKDLHTWAVWYHKTND